MSIEAEIKSENSEKFYQYNINSIPDGILIKNILVFIDIGSLPKLSNINRKFFHCIKTHIYIRIYLFNKEKKIFEEENSEIIKSIDEKRVQYYNNKGMKLPSKEHAEIVMNRISEEDFSELKQYFKEYNSTYEKIITPFLYILGEKPKIIIKPDGSKNISFYENAKKLFLSRNNSDNNITKKICELEIETLSNEIIKKVDNILIEKTFHPSYMNNFSPCFRKLISWVLGVLELHKIFRKYSLTNSDLEILERNEIDFCFKMDEIVLLYYKIIRYVYKFCSNYQNEAKELLHKMNIIIENK